METRFSAASIFTAYTSLTAIFTLITQFYYQFVPEVIRNYIAAKIEQMFDKPSRKESFTLVINQYERDNYGSHNDLYKACEVYISDKLRPSATRLRGSYENLKDPISYRITQGQEFVETLEQDGITLQWRLVCRNSQGEEVYSDHEQSIELCFDLAYKNKVLDNHIPLVVVKNYEDMMKMKKELFLYTFEGENFEWREVEFNHPFTFDVLALDPEQKQAIMDDLDMFIRRKEFYKRVGRAWKRGYLLYGPPGTGKSSLVAAMANYLKFDIYDLQLGAVKSDASLRKLMFSTRNKSILVIEDIDCTIGMSRAYNSMECDNELDSEVDELCHSDEDESEKKNEDQGDQETGQGNIKTKTKLSLSGLLNFIDGLWSSCGDERIIIFTTNVKEKLDPALLRPGRMDMHIHMSYLTMPGFRVLVKNYLGVTEEHTLFKEIEQMLPTANVTPAQVAEELIRSEDADIALSSVVEMLKKRLNQVRKKKKGNDKSKKAFKANMDHQTVDENENSTE